MYKVIDEAEVKYFSGYSVKIPKGNIVRIKRKNSNINTREERMKIKDAIRKADALDNLIETIFANKPKKIRETDHNRRIVHMYEGIPVYEKLN